MNDENFFKKAAAHGEEPPLTPKRTSAVRAALPVASKTTPCGWPGWHVLTDCFNAGFAPAAGLVVAGVGRLGVRLAASAWQIASRAVDPLSREIYNLKTDAVLAGMWVGVMGVNVLPSTAMLMIMCLNLMGAGGPRLFVAGLVLMAVSCLVTLELTGITVSFNSAPLEWWLSLPIIVVLPLAVWLVTLPDGNQTGGT